MPCCSGRCRMPIRTAWSCCCTTASSPSALPTISTTAASCGSYDGISAAQAWSATLASGEGAERLPGLQVTADLFRTLGVPAALGRTFVAGEDQPGRDRVVVLSDALWKRRFGGDRGIVGRTVTLDGEPFTVVGVMPRVVPVCTLLGDERHALAAAVARRTEQRPRRPLPARLCAAAAMASPSSRRQPRRVRLPLASRPRSLPPTPGSAWRSCPFARRS